MVGQDLIFFYQKKRVINLKKLKGLFVEDDPKNTYIYKELLESEGLDLICLDNLLENVSDYYGIIIQNEVDFLIIDYHLDKQVKYKGIDVLKAIREYDDTIYSILLTNYDLEDFKTEFGEYDYEISKKEFSNQYKNIAEKIKRACELREDNKLVSLMESKKNNDEQMISLLEEINAKLEKD